METTTTVFEEVPGSMYPRARNISERNLGGFQNRSRQSRVELPPTDCNRHQDSDGLFQSKSVKNIGNMAVSLSSVAVNNPNTPQ